MSFFNFRGTSGQLLPQKLDVILKPNCPWCWGLSAKMVGKFFQRKISLDYIAWKTQLEYIFPVFLCNRKNNFSILNNVWLK